MTTKAALNLAVTLLLTLGTGAGLKAQSVLTSIPYATVGAYTLSLDLYLPAPSSQPAPVVLWIHGGGWWGGNRSAAAPDAPLLNAEGWAVAAVSYRLSNTFPWPAQLHDCKGAVRWLRANAAVYGLDPQRIAAFGHSAGGHLAAMLGTTGDVSELEGTTGGNLGHSSRVCGVVDFSGPTDLVAMGPGAHGPGTRESTLVGQPIEDILANQESPEWAAALAHLQSTNPANYVTADDPRFYVAHGDSDGIIPAEQSELLVAALDAAQLAPEYRTVVGAGHTMPLSAYVERLGFLREVLSATAGQHTATLSLPARIQMGVPAAIQVSGAGAGDLLELWVSDRRGYAASSQAVQGDLLIDLQQGFVLWGAVADQAGQAGTVIVVPNHPQLDGLNFYLQALVTPQNLTAQQWSTMTPTQVNA